MRVIDSHTAGEPTRAIVQGGPDLGGGTVAERAARLEAQHRDFCTGVLCEPRGHDAMVGALLVAPSSPGCTAGVVYFNTATNLGMCGHATIGLAVTLAHMGVIGPGAHRFDTPVGVVGVELHDTRTATVENVESYRLHRDVSVDVEGFGQVVGDVAWGGNWFFLVKDAPVEIAASRIGALSGFAAAARDALARDGITGADGAPVDHVELFGPACAPGAHSRNFVLCSGGAYDRSPCGTGCSAKMACLAADGDWPPGREWVQESVIGSRYGVVYRPGSAGGVVARITGQAFVTSDATLIFDPLDPYVHGIRF